MRAAITGQQVLHNNRGDFVGFNLGTGICAEHESGIAGLKRDFGLAPKVTRECFGADARTVTVVPTDRTLRFHRQGETRYLVYTQRLRDEPNVLPVSFYDRLLGAHDRELTTAWDGQSFGIRVRGQLASELKLLFDAFIDRQAMIFTGPSNPFGGGGVIIAIRSAVDIRTLTLMAAADLSYLDLLDAAAATGIAERLKRAGKRYYALSPRWANEQKTDIVLWLNPMDQGRNNSGWFTVADLDDWIAGKGKIPIARAVR